MKKLLLFLSLLTSGTAFAQSWAAPGATWYYNYTYFNCTGFERIQRVGDTIIQGHQYDQLETYRKWRCIMPLDSGEYTEPMRAFTRDDNGRVLLWRDSVDYVLYDFNAVPGSTWQAAVQMQITVTPCDTGTLYCDSVSYMIANGDTLKMLYTHPLDWFTLNYTSYMPVVEKIGALSNLFPMPMCVADLPQGFILRCYSDSSGWSWQNPNITSTCDDMLSVGDISGEDVSAVTIASDPLLHKLTVKSALLKTGSVLRVYDCRGQLLLEENADADGSAELNFSVQNTGIYFVTVTNGNSFGSASFWYAGN